MPSVISIEDRILNKLAKWIKPNIKKIIIIVPAFDWAVCLCAYEVIWNAIVSIFVTHEKNMMHFMQSIQWDWNKHILTHINKVDLEYRLRMPLELWLCFGISDHTQKKNPDFEFRAPCEIFSLLNFEAM